MDEIIKTQYTISFDGREYYLFKIEYFYRNEMECVYLTGIISAPTSFCFELPGGYWYADKLPLFNGESHIISKEQYEMAYNIAYSISESITANESIMFDGGSKKFDDQSYAIIRCVTNANLSLYFERNNNQWYEIGQNYNESVFSYYDPPFLRDMSEICEEPIYIDEMIGNGENLIFLLRKGTHSLFMLLSEMFQSKKETPQ